MRVRYRRTFLGPLWVTLSTAIFITGIGYIYSSLFNSSVEQYMPSLAIGFILWILIAGLVNNSVNAFPRQTILLRNTTMPRSYAAYVPAWEEFLAFLHNIIIVLAVLVIFKVLPSWLALLAPFWIGLIVFNGFLCNLWLGPLATRFRDVGQLVGSIMQLMFFLTPVLWIPSERSALPQFLWLNPFWHFIEVIRQPLLGQPLGIGHVIGVFVVTVINAVLALLVFPKARSKLVFWS